MTASLRTGSLHRRHRLSRRRQDDADPPSARERRRQAARDHRQRVRRHRHRRRDPQGLRRRDLPGGEHRRARQRLHLLHRRRRLRAGARPDPGAPPEGRPHPDRDFRAGSAQAAGAGVPVAVGEEPGDGRRRDRRGRRSGAGRRPRRRRPAALAAQRGGDPSLDHDDPVEEVFEDQVACADLVVLSKSDLIDAQASARANRRRRASICRAR